MIAPIVFGCVLLAISGLLFIWWHRRRRVPLKSQDNATIHNYLIKQSRRRFQMNWMVGLCGVSFISIAFLNSLAAATVGLLTIVLVLRILYLAILDVISTQQFMVQSQLEHMHEVAVLQKEIEQYRAEQDQGERNGRGAPLEP